MELENLTISKALSLLEEGEITALQLTEFYLNKINSSKKLNAFCLTTSELALKQAENCDKIINMDQGSIKKIIKGHDLEI